MAVIKNKYLLLAVVALVGLFVGTYYLGRLVGHLRADNSNEATTEALQGEISRYIALVQDKETYIVSVEQQLTTEKEAKKALELTNKDLRAMNVKHLNEISALKLQIDTLMTDISHNGQIIAIQQEKIDSLTNQPVSVKKNAILLPFEFTKKDQWMDLVGSFDNNGGLTVGLKMGVPVSVVTGIDRDKKPICSVLTDNPYIKTLSVQSFKTDPPRVTKYGIGVFIGAGVSARDLKPTLVVGVGMSRNFIRF